MNKRSVIRAGTCAGVVALTLTVPGCAVGPDYSGPPAVVAAGSSFARAPQEANAAAPVARWWEPLNDRTLDELIERAVKSNPSVDIAMARLRAARFALAEEHAKELPTSGASAAYLRAHNLTAALGAASSNGSSDSSIYVIGFDATWEIDLFGGQRRAVEGAAAALERTRASLRDALVSLTCEVAQAYVQLRDAQQRLALTQRNIDIEQRLVDLMQRRRSGGTASDLDVTRLQGQLQNTQASVGALKAEVAAQEDRLALLTGSLPGALDGQLEAAQPIPLPPASVAVGDPAGIVRRRPDIAVAERRLAQQTAAIGQDIAAQFPKLTLLGDVGFAAPSLHTLFDDSSFTYVAAPLLQWTPWDFGRNRARINQARAARDAAEADYRRTVLAALDDAETSLSRYGQQRNTVIDLARAQASAQSAYALTEVRLRGGTASTSEVLDADARRVQAQLDYQDSLAQLTENFVAVQKSLGLGWVEPAS
jgi:NodT family efflux transporter outer membrane factor (OMF) lipoprotein